MPWFGLGSHKDNDDNSVFPRRHYGRPTKNVDPSGSASSRAIVRISSDAGGTVDDGSLNYDEMIIIDPFNPDYPHGHFKKRR